jgi:NAD(P)-dependent dehydrogenase (short-subunit alcohol dehydrogenase family)
MSSFFQGKSICIVGGSGVLGSEIARQLLSGGADVSIVARHPDRVPDDLHSLPTAQGDVRDAPSLASAFDALASNFDGVVNAAGVVAFGSLTDLPAAISAELMAVNAMGTLNILALGATRVNEGGFITSLTGVAADLSLINMAAYCASKAAAHSAMAVAARELRSKKILVLDARPPHTETGLVDRALFGQSPKMPAGLQPTDVAARLLRALESGEKDLPAEAFAV